MARPKKTRKMNHCDNRTRIDDLDDHMLTQILVRLPNCKTVLACSPVNKRWYSLIADPDFSDQFADHKKKTTTLLKGSGSDHEGDEPPWTFITNLRFRIRNFIFASQKLFLPCNTSPPVATFKDLVLTCQLGGLVYYITNPLTKQSVALPPCPADKHQRRRITTFLICQPPYNHNHNQDYKFRVGEIRNFRMGHSLDTCYLVVYCSEIGEWKEINLRVPKEAGLHRLWNTEPTIVVCNGIIYFKSGLCLVALDPFDVNVACGTTLEARVMPPLPDFGYLQESSGQLLVVRTPWLWYQKDGMAIKVQMVVWKLDPNQTPLVWETTFQGLCKGIVNSTELERNINEKDIGVHGHPYNDKLIYMYLASEKQLLLCDTRTGCITSSKSLPNYVARFHRLEQQWWPTSVPALVQCLTDSQ